MGQPTHDPATCTRKGGRWECLHAIDADHFWLGDLMVDLVQLQREETRMAQEPKYTHAQVHGIGFNLGALRLYGRELAQGLRVEAGSIVHVLKRLNYYGLHTGYRESPTERER